MNTRQIPATTFAAFADSDLVRWRALRSCVVLPSDVRWGSGRVTDVRWEGRSDLPDDRGTVYVRVAYEDGLRARVNASAFARLHTTVEIESGLADFIERWFGGAAMAGWDDEARAVALAERDEALRAEQDAERATRVGVLRRRVRERRDR
jgi:hypothetical protein